MGNIIYRTLENIYVDIPTQIATDYLSMIYSLISYPLQTVETAFYFCEKLDCDV